MFRIVPALLVLASFYALAAEAATIHPTALKVRVPTGSNNAGPTGAGQTPSSSTIYTDDVFLQEMTFGSTVFTDTTNFAPGVALEVLSNRGQVNVEWGDNDTASDGDPTPMESIGQPNSVKETNDPAIQDAGLLQVFNSLNLTEMTDGEGGASHSFKVAFGSSVSDNDDGVDMVPEIVMFERGRNDTFDISLMIGGSLETPVLSAPLRISSNSFADVGLRVNTTEIGGAQTLGVGGFDLNDWGVAAGTEVFGFVYSGTGADLAGIFGSGELSQFGTPAPLTDVAPVPLPAGGGLLIAGLVALGLRRARRTVH